MTARRRTNQPALALGLLGLIALMLGAVLYLGRLRSQAAKAAEEAETASVVEEPAAPVNENPFARLGPLPGREGSSDEDPLPDKPTRVPRPGELTASDLWQDALEAVEVAYARIQLAVEAREKGDEDLARGLDAEAVEQFERALDMTGPWAEREVASFDPRDVQVRVVLQARERWREKVLELSPTERE